MTDERWQYINRSCFRGLLRITAKSIPVSTMMQLMEGWDVDAKCFRFVDGRTLEITPDRISAVYGLPCGRGTDLITKQKLKENADFCEQKREQLQLCKKGSRYFDWKRLIELLTLKTWHEKMDIADYWRLYCILCIGSILIPMANNRVCLAYLGLLQTREMAELFNWAAFIQETMLQKLSPVGAVGSASEYLGSRPAVNFHCITHVFYDFIECRSGGFYTCSLKRRLLFRDVVKYVGVMPDSYADSMQKEAADQDDVGQRNKNDDLEGASGRRQQKDEVPMTSGQEQPNEVGANQQDDGQCRTSDRKRVLDERYFNLKRKIDDLRAQEAELVKEFNAIEVELCTIHFIESDAINDPGFLQGVVSRDHEVPDPGKDTSNGHYVAEDLPGSVETGTNVDQTPQQYPQTRQATFEQGVKNNRGHNILVQAAPNPLMPDNGDSSYPTFNLLSSQDFTTQDVPGPGEDTIRSLHVDENLPRYVEPAANIHQTPQQGPQTAPNPTPPNTGDKSYPTFKMFSSQEFLAQFNTTTSDDDFEEPPPKSASVKMPRTRTLSKAVLSPSYDIPRFVKKWCHIDMDAEKNAIVDYLFKSDTIHAYDKGGVVFDDGDISVYKSSFENNAPGKDICSLFMDAYCHVLNRNTFERINAEHQLADAVFLPSLLTTYAGNEVDRSLKMADNKEVLAWWSGIMSESVFVNPWYTCFRAKFIFLPFVRAGHWVLFAAEPSKKKLWYFNSRNRQGGWENDKLVSKRILQCLRLVGEAHGCPQFSSEFSFEFGFNMEQPDPHSCGVFVMFYMMFFRGHLRQNIQVELADLRVLDMLRRRLTALVVTDKCNKCLANVKAMMSGDSAAEQGVSQGVVPVATSTGVPRGGRTKRIVRKRVAPRG